MAAHHHSHDCGGHSASSSVHQTLDEMEFERGLWSAALSGQVKDVETRLQRGDDVNVKDNSGYSALVRAFVVCYSAGKSVICSRSGCVSNYNNLFIVGL